MSNIDSQTLMAYADGELSPADRRAVEQALENSAELRQQLQRMCQLDSLLGSAFNDALHAEPLELRAQNPVGHKRVGLSLWQGASRVLGWQSAAAAAVLVLGVTAGGWYERRSTQGELAISQQQLEQAIDKALETRLSGESLQWSGAKAERVGSITPVRTYKTDQGQYCREFVQRRS